MLTHRWSWFIVAGLVRRICLVVLFAACSTPSASPDLDAQEPSPDADPARVENVELKVDVTLDALAQLGLSDDDADKTRDVWFYDTADLALYEGGTILRARKVHDGGDDTTVKARPMNVTQTAPGWLELPGAKCEIDRTLDHATSSCSLTGDADKGEIDAVADGGSIARLYTADQLVFAGSVAGVIDFKTLGRIGPIASTVWKLAPSTLPPVSVERWVLGDGSTIVEVSTRSSYPAADATSDALLAWLASQGVTLSQDQGSKTRRALIGSATSP